MGTSSRLLLVAVALSWSLTGCPTDGSLQPPGTDDTDPPTVYPGSDWSSGCDEFGMLMIGGICVVGYDNTGANWSTAVQSCSDLGADLCSTSEYIIVRDLGQYATNAGLFYDSRPVWSSSFSDNDGGRLTTILQSADNPSVTSEYSFACCKDATPPSFLARSLLVPVQGSTTNGVRVTYLRTSQDTRAEAAMSICASLRSDLCSKSQYVILNDEAVFTPDVRRLTNEISDNDGLKWADVLGTNTADNPLLTSPWAFACCAWQRPCDNSCPEPGILIGGVCVMEMHTEEDANFYTAARACAQHGADICSNSQMQALRAAGEFASVKAWTNSGADNDGRSVGGLLPTMADDPDPATTSYGYACCL